MTDINPSPEPVSIPAEQAGQTLAAFVRGRHPDLSWSQAKRVVESRRVTVGDALCLDPARRLKAGDVVRVLPNPQKPPAAKHDLVIRSLDPHVVVVEKPSGVSTVRHPSERDWPARRKMLEPTLEDLLPRLIGKVDGQSPPYPRLRVVQRLDKETSGLVVFARTPDAERELGRQFRVHTVTRRYLTIVPGAVASQRVASRLVRDRGDGRRGSTTLPHLGKEAITHLEVVERLAGYTLLGCRLETGRTHQIRIHLAELGHPVCGEKVYTLQPGRPPFVDRSGAPRLALHAVELGFIHPISGAAVHWTMPLPADLDRLLTSLREKNPGPGASR